MKFFSEYFYSDEKDDTPEIKPVLCPMCKAEVRVGYGLDEWILHPACYELLIARLEILFNLPGE